MDKLNVTRITQYLWEDPHIRKKIETDYSLEPSISAEDFSKSIILALKQPVRSIFRDVSNKDVFEAATRALGSNSRQWGTFSAREHELRELLEDYDPLKVYDKWNPEFENEVKTFFPGQTRKNDVTAVFQWSQKLTLLEDFYQNYIIRLASAFLNKTKDDAINLSDEQLLLLICGFCANPPKDSTLLGMFYNPKHYKFMGMGYILSSEFLRNLGWNGFKPDRHIKRLFGFWYNPKSEDEYSDIGLFQQLLHSQRKELNEFIQYSLIGHNITPSSMTYSEMDNLLWAFGSYIAKKGKEADFPILD
ncbi:hypothetical protein PVOR_01580 [Paenibacillus vortex V453]|uniref:Uncharacterized protein n=1 Tax=Paenibacillus vortex V453 TaxID=715225 RepID=A0A2R9T2S3_9BACL|nr:hypothetical protein [Paenibacillus vortex]EFU43861.1 hypothetical protein PVOR_01580 [Paenibacillus vortex V453]